MSDPTPGNEEPSAAAKPESAPSLPRRISPGRKWLYRCAAIILVPSLLFGILELTLRIAGFGEPTSFFVDGSELERPGVWIDNSAFARWVFPRSLANLPKATPFVLSKVKAEKTFRIFVLGESAALGFPDSTTSFARILEVMLRACYPETRFEVVNTAMVAINSHVVLPIARQCADQAPDLMIVHLGNNEVVGPFGAAGVLGPFSPNLTLIRANLAVKTTRSGQLLDRCVNGIWRSEKTPTSWEGMAMFVNSQLRADDPRLQQIYGHFRQNLEAICGIGAKSAIPLVVCTIPVNLRECAPFASLHAPGLDSARLAQWEALYKEGVNFEQENQLAEAISRYQEAGRIDDGFADLAFRLARCYSAMGDNEEAKKLFAQARDLDALRFRSDSTINQTIRSVVANYDPATVRLVDAERAFAEQSPGAIPGEELFLEHVHMNFHGNFLMARSIFAAITDLKPAALGPSPTGTAPLSEKQCAERLGHTEWNEWKFATRIFEQLIGDQPFTGQLDREERGKRWKEKLAAMHQRVKERSIDGTIAEFQGAVQASGGDWMIRMKFGQLLTESGKDAEAYEQYEQALAQMRHNFLAHYRIGNLQLKMRSPRSAEVHFREALRLAPLDLEANIGLAEALEAEGKQGEARTIYAEQLRRNPDHTLALTAMGRHQFRSGNFDEAKILLTQALKREPSKATIHVDLAVMALRQENLDEAIDHLEAALKIQPDSPALREHLADVKKQRDQAKAKDKK